MIKITRSNEHYHNNNEDWLSTYWHFSFADYYDSNNMNFGPLRVFNDDIIQPGTGFDFHPHRDMEIVTYVIDGELEHRDNQGNRGIIKTGEIQRMTAGSGILHSEYNHSKEKPLRLLQMWVFASKKGLAPSWEQQKFGIEQRKDTLLPVIIPEGFAADKKDNNDYDKVPLKIHQDARFYVSTLSAGKKVKHDLGDGRKAYLFVIGGEITLSSGDGAGSDNIMHTRDAARIQNEKSIAIRAEKPTDLVLIDMPEKYAINN